MWTSFPLCFNDLPFKVDGLNTEQQTERTMRRAERGQPHLVGGGGVYVSKLTEGGSHILSFKWCYGTGGRERVKKWWGRRLILNLTRP